MSLDPLIVCRRSTEDMYSKGVHSHKTGTRTEQDPMTNHSSIPCFSDILQRQQFNSSHDETVTQQRASQSCLCRYPKKEGSPGLHICPQRWGSAVPVCAQPATSLSSFFVPRTNKEFSAPEQVQSSLSSVRPRESWVNSH